ncbi:TPA: hypothetical protein RQK06_001670 [Vibrio vulnificus]|nr:hypothetical protein [Vibrio vulnificus]
MSLEPVILNEVQRKAAETQIKIDTQTQSLIAEIATKADEINLHVSGASSGVASHVTQETDRTLSAIESQTTAITAAVEVSRDEVNSTTQTAKNDVKTHVTAETNRVIAAQSVGVKYGHEEIIAAVGTTNRSVKLSQPYTITPPSQDSFIRITLLETSSGIGRKIDLGSGVFNYTIANKSQQNSYLFGVSNEFRVGGRAFGNNTNHVASDGMNPLQHLDGALGMPVKIYGYTDSSYSVVSVAYQIIRVK